MKWYFAIDEAGSLGETGEDAKTAVLSAAALGQLEPHLLYYGARNHFTGWMQAHGVTVIDTEPAFLDAIQVAEAAGIYKAHSIGHWLRIGIPMLETSAEFILYTDCDVVFLNQVNWPAIRPRIIAAAPEFRADQWNYFNAGVMVLNIAAMRASSPAFETLIRGRIQGPDHFSYDDQIALNEAYRGHWDRLDPKLNWKPYWGYNHGAAILHFHGPKIGPLEAIAKGHWPRTNPTALQLAAMAESRLEQYIAWAEALGDRLQRSDLPRAIRFARLASALVHYRNTNRFDKLDDSFMNFCMF